MNGHVARSASLPNKAAGPAYSVLRDVNGLALLKQNCKQVGMGRYTAVSKSVTKSNGTTKGLYYPTSAPLEASRRSQSQHQVEQAYLNNNHRNEINGSLQKSSIDFSTSITLNGKINTESEQHQQLKSHCATSTLILRETGSRDSNYRSAGGSLSCGQPSPSSTADESITGALSPNSLRSEPRPQHQSYWLHQSELVLPTDRESASTAGLHDLSNNRRGQSVTGLTNNQRDSSTRNLASLDTSEVQYYSTSTMIYGSHQIDDDYFNNSAASSGPSHRKIQNLHGAGGAQRRFPSDITLNFSSPQVYTSGNKPGPVTIPARSRSAQPSPGPSPMASPTSFHRTSEGNNFFPNYGSDKQIRSQQSSGLQFTPQPIRRSSPPNVNRNINGVNVTNDDIESPILPSVREIIRQVEAMTESNVATSTSDIAHIGYSNSPSGIPRFQHQFVQQQPQPRRNTTTGFQRPMGSSQRTPSAPQLRSPAYTPIQAKFNAITNAAVQNRSNIAPPVPPHGTKTSKTIIGAFTRRPDVNPNDLSPQQQHTSVHKKTELLSQLPMDYQKLREAFIEQRREIQRLRKQLTEKDTLITQLQSDIRLYEPWR